MRCMPWYGVLGDSWSLRWRHDGDGVLHMLQGCLPYEEESTSWILMILVDGHRDDMLSRTTTTLGGGGCKVLG